MPKQTYKKLGDSRFDKKQKPLDLLPILSEEDKRTNWELEFNAQRYKLLELMDFFKINRKDKDAWFHLSYCLAEHYVPAMQFEKKSGAPVKWNNHTCWGVHAVYNVIKASQTSKTTEKALFYSMPKHISGTSLEHLLGDITKGERIKEEYKKYIKRVDFKLRQAALEASFTEDERIQYFKALLSIKPSKKLNDLNKKLNSSIEKDAVFTFLNGGQPKDNQDNFSNLMNIIEEVPDTNIKTRKISKKLIEKIKEDAKTR